MTHYENKETDVFDFELAIFEFLELENGREEKKEGGDVSDDHKGLENIHEYISL